MHAPTPRTQYPHEKEILFAPLTGLEVRSTRVESDVLVVEAAPSINLVSLTIEQVIGKRKKMLSDMVPGLQSELRGAGLAALPVKGVEFLVSRLPLRLQGDDGPLSHEAVWYNTDAQLSDALNEMLKIRRDLTPGEGAECAKELSVLTRADCEQYGMGGCAQVGGRGAADARKDGLRRNERGGRGKGAVSSHQGEEE